jgi:predicted nuclease of predicted toxin-antitoxin system
MASRLRLLLDESITEPLATNITNLVRSAVHVRDFSEARGKDDTEVAAFANREDRMVVAVDSDFKRKIVVKCGVIKLRKYRNDDECLFAVFRAFWQSGHRSKSKSRCTFLTHEGIRIENGRPFEERWDKNPCPNRGSAS